VDGWINATCARKTNLLLEILREGLKKVLENIIVIAVGRGCC